MIKTPLLTLVLAVAPIAYADQGSFSNSGGSGSGGSGISIGGSSVATPAGTLNMNCPSTGPSVCAGGSLSFASNDGTSIVNAVFTSGSYAESCSGGGKGGNIKCYFSLTGQFSGTWTRNGSPQAITGVTSQSFPAPGTTGTLQGTTALNSSYSPFYYSDSEGILRSDDLMGTNQILYDGAAIGGFYGAYGLALDSQGRIYVADTYNCRVVRIDNMTGANAATYGTCGSGQGQFYDPSGIAVDSAGKIYVMDTGNSRLVRIDNMTGANWVTYGAVGSGVGQFASFISLTLDSANRIYVADTGNRRIVRVDDMTGANWTALTQSQPVNGASYTFASPVAVAVDSAGKIYIADDEYAPAVVRVDDMTGSNWTSIYISNPGSGGPNSIAVDAGGTVYTGGGGVHFVDGMSGVQTSSGSIGPIGSYYVFGITPVPLPNPRPSAISFTPSSLSISQNTGSSSPPQPVSVFNFGGSPLSISAVSASGTGFAQTNNCLGTLAAGSGCTVNVTFTPNGGGTASGSLTITDNSGNLGSTQTIALTGTATAPAASVSPASLNFSSVIVGTTSTAKTVVLTDSGTGPLTVTNISITGPYNQTNNCTTVAAGAYCSVSVTFSPTALGSAPGTLSITDTAGTQTVALSGNGIGPFTLSPTSMEFNSQLTGTTSAPQTVTATNRSSAPITIASIVMSGAAFAISSNTCGASLDVSASCTVGVTFSPTVAGGATGTLTFTDSALGSPQKVSIQGNGTAPVSVSPGSLSFGTVVYGTTTSAKSVTLKNNLAVGVNISSIVASASFNISSDTCAATLAAGASCTVGVTFSPTAAQSYTGTLTVTDDAPNNPQVVNLSGTGSAPVTLSTGSLSFGTVTVGTTSSAKTVTLTNRQSASLSFSSIAASAGFKIATNTCGASLGAGANCTVGVTFSPTASGTVTGTLTFTDTAGNSPQTVSLSGTGR